MSGEVLAARGDWSVIDWSGRHAMLHRAGDDLNEAQAMVLDEATWAWLMVCAAPAALAALRAKPEEEPGTDGGSAPGEPDPTESADTQTSLLGEQLVPDPPRAPRKRP